MLVVVANGGQLSLTINQNYRAINIGLKPQLRGKHRRPSGPGAPMCRALGESHFRFITLCRSLDVDAEL